MDWDPTVKERFNVLIAKIPVFHRHITEEVVVKRAEENAALRKAPAVEEQDVINAFFSDVPTPFYSMMIRLLDQSDFDYKKYGFPKNNTNFK